VVAGLTLLRTNVLSQRASEVVVELAEDRVIRSSILASGTLTHDEEVNLTTEVIGRVTEVLVTEADVVHAGQLLLQIDDEQIAKTVEQREANVRVQEIAIESQMLRMERLQQQWERQSNLFEQGVLDAESFEEITSQVALAEVDLRSREESLRQAIALLEEAEDQLSKTRVYSPIDGLVTTLDIEVGETAISSTTNIAGSSLMTIANPDSMITEINVDEADIANIAVGQEAEIVAIAYPTQPMRAVVDFIAVSARQRAETGNQSLSFIVELKFTDTNGVVLRPGMSARAEIFTSTNEESRLAVPIQAISLEENLNLNQSTYSVFKYEDGIARKTEVEVGLADDEYQEVLSGLMQGDQVIVSPDRILRNLNDGDAVSFTEE
jgi:HlyD family secretion protein